MRILAPLFISILTTGPINAQFFLSCETGSSAELEYNIAAHEMHSYRLNQKFLDGYYYQGNIPDSFEPIGLEDIHRYLRALESERRAALLFYSHSATRVCVWLVSPRTGVTSHVTLMDSLSFKSLGARLTRALGVAGVNDVRSPRRRGVKSRISSSQQPSASLEETLRFVSELLFPASIVQAMAADGVNVLAIVPVSPIAVIPFGALLIGETPLVDLMPVSVVPGFFSFRNPPSESRHQFESVVVAGDPLSFRDSKWLFPQLPGARAEATEVSEMLGTTALLGGNASKQNVASFLRSHPTTELIYLATHGIADPTDPLDGSFLLMSDGRWAATEVQKLRLQNKPLVVLSACQTGLGRDFDVGTIGMARAWERAGASAVVMSLWSVDDRATRHLMTRFLRLAQNWPADEALRRAMQLTRVAYPDPANWAGFAVFGAPGR